MGEELAIAMTFPVSGVQVSPLVPLSVAFAVSLFTSMCGVSGAFLLLPFQVSVLGFTSPAVSPTNLFYNVVAIPAGVYRYIREGRMTWPLTWVIVAGTVPGVCIGVVLRVKCLPDPTAFKVFVGCVLLYVGGRLLYDVVAPTRRRQGESAAVEARLPRCAKDSRRAKGDLYSATPAQCTVRTVSWSWRRITYEFSGERFSFSTLAALPLVLAAGVVSGTYGIGGGAIVGPLLVACLKLPVHTVAGAVLTGTFITSLAGVVFYRLAAVQYAYMGVAIAPDWLLGALFGVGGAVGMYLGARCQKYVPARALKAILAAVLLLLAARYVGSSCANWPS